MLPILLQVFFVLLLPRRNDVALAAGPTHYEVLGLPKDVSQADLKRTYKQLARQYHPDKNPAEDAQKRFIEIQKAYEVLSDPAQRRKYDSSSGWWSDDDDSSHERYDGPPDGGRGVVFDDVETLRNALQGEELWLLHVYTDRQELFGSWMMDLFEEKKRPGDMHLGHINIERDEELLRAVERILGGRLNTAPILVLCQRGRKHAFVPDFQSIFFGLDSAVSREVLRFVDYSREVAMLYSDEACGSFMEFQPGGSSRLRVLFVIERTDDRKFDIYSASMRLRGLASVAQLGYYHASDMYGHAGRFLSKFAIQQLPTVIISDPLTGGFEKMSGRRALERAQSVAENMINGVRVSSNMYPILELDLDTYAHRCGTDSENCDWIVVFASSAALEKQPESLQRTAKVFTKACETLENAKTRLPGSFACFWLRLGRAPTWTTWLLQHGEDMSAPISHAVFVVSKLVSGNGGIHLRVAPATHSTTSTGQWSGLFKWCASAMTHRSQMIEEWPAIPPALTSHEELQEPSHRGGSSTQDEWQIRRNIEEAVRQSMKDLFQDQDLDLDVGLIVLPLGILLLSLVCLALCACRASDQQSVDESLRKLELWIIVKLRRDDLATKWGFGIAQAPNRCIRITNIFEGGLLEAWNAAETRPERRVKEGDDISAVQFDGRTVTHMQEMASALKTSKELALTIVLNLDTDTSRAYRLTGGAVLQGLTLNQCADLRRRPDGVGNDLEILSLHEPLVAWNEFHRKQGASYTTYLDAGDRVVAVNGNANVQSQLNVQSPNVILVKWRSPEALRADRFDVDLERSDVNESWGFQLRMLPGDSANTHVLAVARIIADGLLSRWRGKACANDGRTVQLGDRLVMVNGMEGTDAIRTQLRKRKVKLCFERWCGDIKVQKCMENGFDTIIGEIEAEPEPEVRDAEDRPSPPEKQQMIVDRCSQEVTTATADPRIASAGPQLGVSATAEQTNSTDGWDFDLDDLLEDTTLPCDTSAERADVPPVTLQDATLKCDASVERAEILPPALATSGALPHEQSVTSASPQDIEEEKRLIASSKSSCTASGSLMMSPRLRKLDVQSLRVKADGLVVLCSSGSEEFVADLALFENEFGAGNYPVCFFHEACMPVESLLVIFPRHRLCRFLHRQESLKRGVDLLLEAGSIVWQVIAGDVSLLRQNFEPSNINEGSSLWSAELLS